MQPQFDPNSVYEADYRIDPDGSVMEPERPKSPLRRALGPVGVALVFIATKLKWVLSIFKFKFVATSLTALLSIGAYALLFPWQFAVGLVALIFVHELGHVAVLRHYGVKASAPIFIPFMGALIAMRELPRNARMEAFVGLGGPYLGSLGALACYIAFRATDHNLWLVLTYIGLIINLFNLLPIMPLDGGRIVGSISRWIWVIGYALAIVVMFLRPNAILLLVLFFGAGETWAAIRGRGQREYYTVAPGHRLQIALLYFGLMAILAFGIFELQPLMEVRRP